MKDEPKKKDVEKRLRLWLLSGKTITHNEAQRMWGTNRLSEYIRICRKTMEIRTERISENGDTFGRYSWVKPEKVNRITEGKYQRV